MNQKSYAKRFIAILALSSLSALPLFSAEAASSGSPSFEDSFKKGKLKAELGTYIEATVVDASNKNFGWGTGYIQLNYETLEWNRLKMGVAFLGHNQLWNVSDSGANQDPYAVDIETRYSMPELYLSARVLDKTNVVVGRFNHQKISRIDDTQSQGFYIQSKDIPNVEIILGAMEKFAELDYDDGEDFGRTNGAQDLSNEGTYGNGSGDQLFFGSVKVDLGDLVSLKPYVMSQNDYATVYGMDTNINVKLNDVTDVGADVFYYTVNSEGSKLKDSDLNYAVIPYFETGPVKFSLGYVKLDDNGNNKPEWLEDYFIDHDQKNTYGLTDMEAFVASVKYKINPAVWVSAAIASCSYDMSSKGDHSVETEFQAGYQLTKAFDLNLRLFDVNYSGVVGSDYQKVEFRGRFKF
jgi:hypothetical protein